MIRFAWLFARLRWRLAVNGIRGAFRRDTAERLSRISALLVLVLLFLLFLGAASILGLLGYTGGRRVGEGAETAGILLVGRILLLVVLGLLMLVSLMGATTGTIAAHSRLRLLPIPRRALHLVEALASLADPWVVFIVPALLLFSVGFGLAGRADASILALAAALAMIALLASLATLLSMLMSWLLRSRRRAEMFTLVIVLAISLLAVLPILVTERARDTKPSRRGRVFSAELRGCPPGPVLSPPSFTFARSRAGSPGAPAPPGSGWRSFSWKPAASMASPPWCTEK